MIAPLRLAGWGTLADGAAVTWTVAEGRRGRRWREVVAHGDAVGHSLLLETGADGRFSHLELARAGGLWTFHPEADGTLHGNHVDPAGRTVRHVEGMRFEPRDLLVIEGSPLGAAAVAWHLSSDIADGSSATYAGVILRADGVVETVPVIRVMRSSEETWQIGDGPSFDVDRDGLPLLVEREIHALELD